MLRRSTGRAALVAVALCLLVSIASSPVVAGGSGPGAADATTDTEPALRDLVRALGEGTALDPVTDAVAAVGTDATWRRLGVAVVGGGGVLVLAFGPVVALVAFHWTVRRLRWLFWSVLAGSRRLLLACWRGCRRRVGRQPVTASEGTTESRDGSSVGDGGRTAD